MTGAARRRGHALAGVRSSRAYALGNGGSLLDRDLLDVLHTSERSRVTRVSRAGHTVIRKEPLGADTPRRVRHELAMLERLRGVVGVVQLAEAPRDPGSILLVDVDGTSLAAMPKPLAADRLLAIALDLARAVAEMHRRGVMHRDICPANVVVGRDGAPCLIDFALASSPAELGPDFTHHGAIAGTLPYLAPEQTGRTGRAVDERADLYALGATFFELATGEPPFGSGDALRIVHDHLARVPRAPAHVNPAVPEAFSAIVMHLLEKEPDNRYQTADGLVHDLERVRDGSAGAPLRVGGRDGPARRLPRPRIMGRDAELATLLGAFEDALAGGCRGVLLGGAPGVGKTTLADALRPVVASRGGVFAAGKFDQHRRDLEFDAVHQALRAVGRVLLGEPEHEVAKVRARILAELGANAGLLVAAVPEFAVLLEVGPDAGDPLTAQDRAARAALAVWRAVASPQRPVVVFVDDLQWAGRSPLGFVDLVLRGEPIAGLLLIGAYRDGEAETDSLAPLLSAWRDEPGVRELRLNNLPTSSLVDLVAELLRVERAAAADLVEVIEPRTSGNPFATLELLDALRRDDVLRLTADGWRWDQESARARLERSEPAELVRMRAGAMTPRSRELLEAMACLGGRAPLSLLQTATGEPVDVVEQQLAPALDEGLLVGEPDVRAGVRFRHDQIRQVVADGLDPQRRGALQLAMARRLAADPEEFAAAAEQYLPVVGELEEPAERHRVVALLRRAADQAKLVGDHILVDALLTGALRLVDETATATAVELRSGRHAARFSLGRLEEADADYEAIARLCADARDCAEATAVQVRSLSHRAQFAPAIELGLAALRECGIDVPDAGEFATRLDEKFDRLHRWLDSTTPDDELARQELADPGLLAISHLIDAVLPLGYFVADSALIAWLAMEAVRIWIEHGPSRILVGSIAHAAYQGGPQGGDNHAAYRSLRRIIAIGEGRGYEPGTSQARHMAATMSGWFEPIETGVEAAHRARHGLLAGGELAYAGYTYQLSVPYSVDCAATLASFAAEVDAGLAFLRRTGNEQSGRWLDSYAWLIGVLGGSAETREAVPLDRYAGDPTALIYAHICRGIAAAIFGDPVGLRQHSAAAMDLLGAVQGFYSLAQIRLLRGLALAEEARAANGDERDALLAELEEVPRWLAARAADAPANFLHLQRLLEAERAWAVGEFRAAALAFDAARREVAGRQRPWHRALIAERAARFQVAHGLEHAGHELLAEARRSYLAWGATAKVDQMDWAYPALRSADGDPAAGGTERAELAPVTTGTIDLLGVLAASQALSSETSVQALHARVTNVLQALAGATGVTLVLWDEERQDWTLPDDEHALPMSVLRYAQRTREPVIVADGTVDDRFARDPYLAGLGVCSLLAVPVVSRGTLQAVLVLENRLLRGAFTAERLDLVKLIAGQLAVSLDNARVYAGYRRIADEQAALRRVATLVAQGPSPAAVFDGVATELQQLLAADGVTLGRYEPGEAITVMAHRGFEGWQLPVGKAFPVDGESVTAKVRRTGQPARMEYVGEPKASFTRLVRDLGVRSSIGAPIVIDGRLWGIAVVYWTGEERPPAESVERIDQFAKLLETAIANADSREQLVASRARLLAAGDSARRRVVRDLHDGAQQRLVQAVVALKLAQQAIGAGGADAGSLVGEALAAVEQGHEELRELAHGILPTSLTRRGLRSAVEAIVTRLGVPVDLDVPDGRFPAEIEANAYFIVAEALTNVVKHASATRAEVRASVQDGVLRVEVRDDGIGGADPDSHGLVGMSDRAAALGGRLDVDSPPGAGTSVVATLPIAPG
jgi:signal transduction histidine kinase